MVGLQQRHPGAFCARDGLHGKRCNLRQQLIEPQTAGDQTREVI
jgi:hypothetical protein